MDEQNDLYSRLGSIEAKVDILLASDTRLNERVVALEKWRNILTGAYGLLVLIAGFLKFER